MSVDLRDGFQPSPGQLALTSHLDASLAAVDLALSELDEHRDRLTAVRADLVRVIESLASPCSSGEAVPASHLPAASTPVDPAGEGTAPGARQRAVKPEPAGVTFRCEQCGETFPRPQALGAHRRYKHPKPAALDVTPAVVNPAPATTAGPKDRVLPDGKVLACTEKGCGHEAGSIRDLIHHTITSHDRQPYDEEKWPVQRQAVTP